MLKDYWIVLVDQRLDHCACMCPMVVDSECDFYCCTCLAVSSGHKYRKPALVALVKVEMTGKKREAL